MAEPAHSWGAALIGLAAVIMACQHTPAAGSRPSTTGVAPKPIHSHADCPKDMVFIPEGDLSYVARVPGSTDKTPHPQLFHLHAFCIDRVEPQNSDWKQALPACGTREDQCITSTRSTYSIQPLGCVTHEQARCFCEHSPSGVRKRLPTDSEWLYAALGSDGRKFPWGDEPVPRGADERNFCIIRDDVEPKEWLCDPAQNTVDRSPFGVLGMATNALELNGTCISVEGMHAQACLGRSGAGLRNPYLSSEVLDGLVHTYWLEFLFVRPEDRVSPSVSFRCATSERLLP